MYNTYRKLCLCLLLVSTSSKSPSAPEAGVADLEFLRSQCFEDAYYYHSFLSHVAKLTRTKKSLRGLTTVYCIS